MKKAMRSKGTVLAEIFVYLFRGHLLLALSGAITSAIKTLISKPFRDTTSQEMVH